MFPWVFRATELLGTIPPLRGWDGPALPAWANPTRDAKPSFPLGRDCMLLRHGDVSMLPWTSDMNIEAAWLVIWLPKKEHRPHMVLYVSNHGTFSMRLHFNLWSISQQVSWDICTCRGLWILGEMMVSARIVAALKFPFLHDPSWSIVMHHDPSWY